MPTDPPCNMQPIRRLIAGSFALLLVSSVLGVGTVTAVPPEPTDHLLVTVESTGAATVSMVSTVDLTDPDVAAGFDELAADPAAIAALESAYADGIATVATETAAAVGRPMSVESMPASFDVDGAVGISTLTVRWTGFAAVTNDGLVIAEPFASGYEADRPVYLDAPTGYTVHADPPAVVDDSIAVWPAGTDLTGVSATLQPESEPGVTPLTGITIGLIGLSLALSAHILGRITHRG